MQIPF